MHAHYIKFNHNTNEFKYNASIYNTEERESVLKCAYEFNVVNALNDWRDAYEEWWDYGKKPTNLIITVQHSKESDKYIDDENIKILINNLIYEEYTFQLANKEKLARVELFKAIEKDKIYNKLRKGIEPNYLKPAYNMLSNFHRIKKDGRILQRNTYK